MKKIITILIIAALAAALAISLVACNTGDDGGYTRPDGSFNPGGTGGFGELDTPVSPEEIENAQEIPAEPEFVRLCRLPDGSKLCDYASAGNRFTPENTLRVWLPKR